MNRIIKAAVAVAMCGLAAAVAVPVQAQNSFVDRGEAALLPNIPQVNELGSVIGKGQLDAKRLGAVGGTLLNGQDAASASRAGLTDGPFEQVQSLVQPVLGAPPSKVADGSSQKEGLAAETLHGAWRLAGTATEGLKGLKDKEAAAGGVTEKVDHAVPRKGRPELAPLVRDLTPVEATPVVNALPGAAGAATIDEIAPLVDDAARAVDGNANRGIGSTSEMHGAVVESVAQATDLAAQN